MESHLLLNRLRFKHLALLVALDELGTLHAAAAAIHMAQPSATKLLADIEQAFGFKLFERLPRGMRPSPLGREVLAYARRTQAGLARFLEELDAKHRGGHGVVSVGAIMGAAPDVLALAVAELKQERPLLQVRIFGETGDRVAQLLERREIDFAVGRFSTPLQHNLFAFEPLARERLCLVVRAGQPLARRRRLALAELAGWPWILQPVTTTARQLLEKAFEREGLRTPANVVECSSVFATLQLLQATDSVALLPEPVVRNGLAARLLVALPVELGEGLSDFGLLTHREGVLSEPAQAFVALLRRHAARTRRHSRKG